MQQPRTASGRKVLEFIEVFTKLFQWLIQLSAIGSLIILSAIGIVHLYIGMASKGDDVYVFIEEILHAIEILFIAPLPILIIFSYRRYILVLFQRSKPPRKDNNEDIIDKMMNPVSAKQAFTSCLIGVTSTIILGRFIEHLHKDNKDILLNRGNDDFYMIIFGLIFLVIQISYYYFLSKHPK